MVKIVLAGGAGNVGREVLEALLVEGKHKIKVFSRKEVPVLASQGVTVDIIDYLDKAALVHALEGVDTVLSFIITFNDPNNQSQTNSLMHASKPAFVGSHPVSGLPEVIAECLHMREKIKYMIIFGKLIRRKGYPHPSAKFMQIFPMPIDVENCRAIIHKDTKARITLTSVQDLARFVTKVVDYEGAWPEVSGFCANQMRILDFIGLCEKIRVLSNSNFAYELLINAILFRTKVRRGIF
ncbi:hypothetical protein BOTNAR_0379g00030 [Botryotinia narcissicola]|uniref:NAD(P)-binding domain-containing protein n=1 Tax=Botryotinia narcissicola TaxID=278944 RepID=A0A4Z1HPX3_9HELO|nr:hypothetical protein BOTNAR_0379g00030 [Botryotinia narcissicola]